MRIHFKIQGDEEFYPGPLWEPTVYDGAWPHMGGSIGDLYINRHNTPGPQYYVFVSKGNCWPISEDEVTEWRTGGLMRALQ